MQPESVMRRALLASASGLALLAGGSASAGTPFRSVSQALAAHGSAVAAANSAASGTKAAQQAAIGVQNLQAATTRFLSLQQALSSAASNAAQFGSGVPNGLAVGGLQPAKGYNTPGSGVWQGVSSTQPITQSSLGGTTTVTINQSSPQAVLNWQSFNVGRNTTVNFNQSKGGAAASTWSVLNRVTDPSASPTEILGSITAPGQVLVLNVNGVLFAPGAQVSLHSLIAGAVSITNAQYLANGIYSPDSSTPAFLANQGVVEVAQGAQIITTAATSVTSGGGNVILLGAGAINSGTIETPGGQTILAAGQSFILQPGLGIVQSATGSLSGNTQSTVLGSEIQTGGDGVVANRGIITATTGDITMAGQTVDQAGVLMSSTSVARRGTIHLLTNLTNTVDNSDGSTSSFVNTGGTITLEPGSVTEILPDSSATTALNSAQAAGYITQQAYGSATPLANEATLPDQPGLSRIEITSGGLVTFSPQSITLAPAGQIAVDSNGRIFAGNTAQLDVSGLTNVSLPMAANQLAVSVEPFNLRDSPLNNSVSGSLNSSTIYLDIRQLTSVAASLADTEVRDYTAGGLLEVSGELGNIGHTESEWSTVGGTIDLYANEVVTQPGSVFNIAGGSVSYQAGYVRQTYLIGPDGILYNANTAPDNYTYSGIYAGAQFSQPRWHVTDTYNSPLMAPEYLYDPAYTAGRDAGKLVLSTPSSVFGGSIEAGVSAGLYQTQAQPAGTTDPFLVTQASAPLAGTLTLGDFSVYGATGLEFFPTRVTIDQIGSALSSLQPASAPLPADLVDTAAFSASQLAGLGGLSISVGDLTGAATEIPSITIRAPLEMAPGAVVSLQAPVLDVKAAISAPSGSITLETAGSTLTPATASVTVGEGVPLTTTGLFTNAVVDPASASNAAYANGGSISIESNGALDLAARSKLDASAGAAVTNTGFAGGNGGNVTIIADDPSSTVPSVLEPVTVDSAITAYGVGTSGTLSLTAPQIFIAPYGVSHARDAVYLTPAFFDAGFNDYLVNGFATPASGSNAASVTVEPGTKISPVVPVLIESPNGSSAPSGAPGQGLVLYLPPEYLFDPSKDKVTQRTGASITLASFTTTQPTLGSGGPVVVSQGASITVDQGQSVTLESYGQVTEDGAITAPSGTIALLNLSTIQYVNADQSAQISVWVGQHAVLNAAGVAQTALDTRGDPFGVVPGGGSIEIGGIGDFTDIGNATAPEAFVFVRPGAILDASGTSAPIEVETQSATLGSAATNMAGTLVQESSAGGTISLVSASGIYMNGVMRAESGGAGAAGGTLRLQLDTEEYQDTEVSPGITNPAWVLTPHRILVSQTQQQSPLSPYLQPGDPSFLDQPGVAGQAAISQQQITAGGFGNVVLFARDQIAFDGSVDLHAAQSITLEDYTTSDTSLSGHVALSAPYVLLAGAPTLAGFGPQNTYGVSPLLAETEASFDGFSKLHAPCFAGTAGCTGATFTVSADLIDLENNLRFGANTVATNTDPSYASGSVSSTIDVSGFERITLSSTGDIRFAASNLPITTANQSDTLNKLLLLQDSLETSGDLSLQALRIYPVTGVTATVDAGMNPFGVGEASASTTIQTTSVFNAATLDITGLGGQTGTAPLSAFGSISFLAGSIDQAGYVFAPLGDIGLSAIDVTLAPKSVTSVSADGLLIPFGGTTDGVSYSYAGQVLGSNGVAAGFAPASYGAVTPGSNSTPSNQGISFDAASVDVRQNAVLDVSGGGTLTGGGGEVLTTSSTGSTTLLSQGFISGSGGSTDVLISSIISFNAASHSATQSLAGSTGAGIYAILPRGDASYAPTSLLDASANYVGSEPGVGAQVKIGAGVPGLAAGTYTLLPSYYALLPGAYRVQLGAGSTATSITPTSPDGLSFDVSGYLGVANTGIQSNLPTTLLITPGANVLRYSQYDQQDFADFAVAQAAVFNTPRPYLPEDAGVIDFTFFTPSATGTNSVDPAMLALQFSGVAKLSAASGGYDGAVGISGDVPDTGALEILAPGSKPFAGVVSVPVESIDALKAPLLEIGGYFGSPLNTSDYVEFASPQNLTVTVDPGAKLNAGAVWLFAVDQITISPGATINTLGNSVNLPDSRTGVVFVGGGGGSTLNTAQASATVGVANGDYVGYAPSSGSGNVSIGTENTAGSTYNPATLYADNYVGVFGGGNIAIASSSKIAADIFQIAVPEINVGTIGGAQSAPGFNLTQTAIDQLLTGNAAAGAPAIQDLELTASASLNFFGSVSFGGNGQPVLPTLTLTTPAIYGVGGAGDVASLTVGDLVWNGSAAAAGPVIPGGPGTGAGTLQVNAQQILFGYPTQAQAQDQTSQNRLVLGFANVDFSASEFVSANNLSALSVYQAQGAYAAGSGYAYSGGNLTIATPLLTTAPGATLGMTAGGGVALTGFVGFKTATTLPSGLGGAISITSGGALTDTTSVVLPGGSLVLDAQGNVGMGAGASIDLGGRALDFFGVTENSWGGTLSIESSAGNVSLDPAASINIAAPGNAAGAIDITAEGGTVSLLGRIAGTAGAGFAAGSIDIRAENLGGSAAGFTALNTLLDAGGVDGARGFEQTGPGDLTIGNEIVAQTVSVSVDQGNLTVTGTINASGAGPGTISLAAGENLTLAPTALLDAHSSVLQTDSGGAAIAAENTGEIALTVSTGTLTIDSGASFNLTSPDGVARGDIELNVPRAPSSGGANIEATGQIGISGAGTIAVNAFRTYTPSATLFANQTYSETGSNGSSLVNGVITQADLDSINADSAAFIDAAVSNGALTGPLAAQLAGISGYGSAFHLRPGVEIESDAYSGGTLTIGGSGATGAGGDINLAGYRYASVNPADQQTSVYGSGEPGVLWLRASGSLNVFGSLTDGFAPPPATPDDTGWVLQSGTISTAQNLVLTQPIVLVPQNGKRAITSFPVGDYSLGYQVTIANGALLNAGAAAPVAATLTAAPDTASITSFLLNGTITLPSGQVIGPGQVVQVSQLVAGTTISAGTVLPFAVTIGGAGQSAGLALPAGTNFGIFGDSSEALAATLTLQPGDVIPAYASLQFEGGASSIATRPTETVDGAQVQGQIWGAAPLLAAGDLSWSLRLVSGADLAAADSRAVLPASTLAASATAANPDPGSLVLSDSHYAAQPDSKTPRDVADFSVVRTGTGYLDLVSGGSITEASLFGVYTAGTQSSGVTQGSAYDQALPNAAALASANGADYSAAIATYQAYYPTGGGNLFVSAQHDIVGDTYVPPSALDSAGNSVTFASNSTAQWLWWQGDSANPGAWWINFGSFVDPGAGSGVNTQVYLTGFTGFGTLGGGNATVLAGRNLGVLQSDNNAGAGAEPTGATGAVNVAIASTGRADPATGQIEATGGGTLTLQAGGGINPGAAQETSDSDDQFNGVVGDLRGNISIKAGGVGSVVQSYQPLGALDPRPIDPFLSETFQAYGGPDLVLGDGSASLQTRGDLVLSGVGDPTTTTQYQLLSQGLPVTTVFSLWQPATAVSLQSLGGNVVPITAGAPGANDYQVSTDGITNFGDSTLYPPSLGITAFSGNVQIESDNIFTATVALELFPSPSGQLQVLAGNAIYDTTNGLGPGNDLQVAFDISGAATTGLPTALAPSYTQGVIPAGIFATEPDAATGLLHQGDSTPARFYAVSGDIVGLLSGQICACTVATATGPVTTTGDIAGKAVQVRAGQDVIGFGGVVLDNNAADISTIVAGRDVIYANEQIAGPGLLEVQAGRNVYQGDQGSLISDGEIGQALTVATRNDGAGISVLAGVGASGPDLTAFANLYLDPANLADPSTPLQNQPGKVERTYQAQLLSFLQTRFGYTGTAANALAAFLALPPEQQTAFLLSVYFDELNQSGLDYNNTGSRFYHSYLEGQDAISALFPDTDKTGKSAPDGGSLTLFSGKAGDSGIHTLFGGGITTVVPYGVTSLGNYGFVPGPGAGLVTEGSGDINMYSYGSVELGQSRVLTTFGGNILIWMSSDGEINAGRGSKSTVLNAPIAISYDNYGNVSLSPTVPSTGAGIGTISPIPEVPAGDVNLIAPVGSVNAGEAGIRASGNANIAALTVVNSGNLQVGGKSTGLPTVTAPSAAAQAAASSAGGAATNSAGQANRPAPTPEASVIEVEVLSISGDTSDEEERRRRKHNGA